METITSTKLVCYHCGDNCPTDTIRIENKNFCCEGCKTVYNLLEDNGLCNYYDLEKNPGIKIKTRRKSWYAFLDSEEVVKKLYSFQEGDIANIQLYIPSIHCSSCVWLLENLYKLKEGIITSRVNFTRKEIWISFNAKKVSLREIAEILDSFGYPPSINMEDHEKGAKKNANKGIYYKIGVAGFCSGNIMLLSFPEYFGIEGSEEGLKILFGYLNMLLAIPVVFYCAGEYFRSARKGLSNRVLNLDLPISIGIAAVFLRSIYEVILQIGPGYFDSLTGLIFFLLIGKWYQSITYKHLSFEKDYKSYFPIAVTKLSEGKESSILVKELKKGDVILVHNNEIIPSDSTLLEGNGLIDYSFVTGESGGVGKKEGELIYAGGRQTAGMIKLKVEADFSKSHFLQLWSREVFKKNTDAYLSSFILSFSKYFTYGTILIAFLTFLLWYIFDPTKILFSVTSVLLVACPCALALALPFGLTNTLKLLGRHGLYLKNSDVTELLSEVDTIVFDKTGTITKADEAQIDFVGESLSRNEMVYLKSAFHQSSHPLSRAVYKSLQAETLKTEVFEEKPSEGFCCQIGKIVIKAGSSRFIGINLESNILESRVYVCINAIYRGYFRIHNVYRTGMDGLFHQLYKKYELHVLSGDNASETMRLHSLGIPVSNMRFNQSPSDKLDYIESLKNKRKKVLMIGDGLNDAGALKAADVGLSVSENIYSFSPSCDGIIDGNNLQNLYRFILSSQAGMKAVRMSLILSLFYNAVGLFFAIQGLLSPLIAAILMPLSSVTVVSFVILVTEIKGKNIWKK